jgi:hypothetical protein
MKDISDYIDEIDLKKFEVFLSLSVEYFDVHGKSSRLPTADEQDCVPWYLWRESAK